MKKTINKYKIPIWLSDWTFKDSRGNKHIIQDVVVKGKNKGDIWQFNGKAYVGESLVSEAMITAMVVRLGEV